MADNDDRASEFELTEEHLKLLCSDRTFVQWQDCETGAPEIDPKRPYGNSYVAGDVIEILGWPEPPRDEDGGRETPEWDALEERALQVHRETVLALQIILSTRSFEPGKYVRVGKYEPKWRRV